VRRALERIRAGALTLFERATTPLDPIDRPLTGPGARSDREPVPAHGIDRGPLVACTVGTLSLVFMEYTPERGLARSLYALAPSLYAPRWVALVELGLWIAVRLLGFFVLPALAVRLVLRARVLDYGLRRGSLRAHLPVYGGLFVVVLPCLVLAALRPEFARYYPFYRLASASWLDLAAWELLYALHFVALEFFFRGFWLTACRRSFGGRAVYVAVAPYCMIHFTKPLLEVLAAIPAGIVLGWLAMRARSIWGGAALHIAVAWTMDALALSKGSGWPERLTPW
jgi:membrane protease YdiL (CAAX protease family)